MASRRTRIKGIANIPQRRKNTATNEEQAAPQVHSEQSSKENINLTFNIDKIPEDKELHLQAQKHGVDKSDILREDTSSDTRQTIQYEATDGHTPTISNMNIDSGDNARKICIINDSIIIPLDIQEDLKPVDDKKTDTANENDKKPNTLLRRKYIKPMISANVINRKLKEKAGKESVNKTQIAIKDESEQVRENDATIVMEKLIIPQGNMLETIPAVQIKNREQEHVSVTNQNLNTRDIKLEELQLSIPPNDKLQQDLSLGEPLDTNRKATSYLNINNTFDNEYPPPPPSPSKINRSRIKAIPRLSSRKTSFSASESEDESRRNYNRNRNNSVCSTASGITEPITECLSPQRRKEDKEIGSVIQKKCNRTEQSRKLAEARRDFQRRFGTNTPDRHKLTMIDLIFYNPSTNPMNNGEGKPKQAELNEEIVDDPTNNDNEKIDDSPPPEAKEDENKSDEENEMPVPQIKIGPSGEIILDEKSLVIESKQVKKQREELQKTQLVNDDFNTSYGIYKKQKRSKFWTQNETLRFYKALNTIGTDFAFMCELFPRRTRRELKMKFKKEERINSSLINKAITQPCNFDFMTLKHEVEMEEKELAELEKMKEDEAKLKKQKFEERTSKKRKAVKDRETEEQPAKKPVPKKRFIRRPRISKLSIESVLDDSDADVSDIATQSESEDEISMPLKPTRSGRVPKATKKFDCTETTTVENIIKNNKLPDVKPDAIEPGSIMVLTEKGPNDEPVYKIYMVTPDQNATPLDLTSDVLSKVMEFKKGLTAQNIMTISANNTDDEDTIEPENNMTIPADESVTTLRADNSTPKTDIGNADAVSEMDVVVS